MRSFAYIYVRCDYCDIYEEEVELNELVEGWSEKDVDSYLLSSGWKIDKSDDICPMCANVVNGVLVEEE